MKKLLIVATFALTAAHVPAFAEGDSMNSAAKREAFFAEVAKKSPDVANALQAFGRDYAAKCGAEPTVAQYVDLEGRSPAFTYRLAVGTLLGNPDSSTWTDKERALYASLMQQVKCAAPVSAAVPVSVAVDLVGVLELPDDRLRKLEDFVNGIATQFPTPGNAVAAKTVQLVARSRTDGTAKQVPVAAGTAATTPLTLTLNGAAMKALSDTERQALVFTISFITAVVAVDTHLDDSPAALVAASRKG